MLYITPFYIIEQRLVFVIIVVIGKVEKGIKKEI